MTSGVKLPLGTALLDAILGYVVVFIGLGLLMAVIMLVGKIMVAKAKQEAAAAVISKPAIPEPAPVPKKLAPGSAGELKLYDTDPRDAAMIMAIVANKLQKPLNELRFKSIKEVK
jgi:Na+-transporting methylmalonyl-CoA/oxaloacetate decarboxylase gamma subunit